MAKDGREYAFNAGVLGLIPGLGRSAGEGNGKPLQYSCLENPIGTGAWRATVSGVTNYISICIYPLFFRFFSHIGHCEY